MTTPTTTPARDVRKARRTVVLATGIAAVVIAVGYPFLGPPTGGPPIRGR